MTPARIFQAVIFKGMTINGEKEVDNREGENTVIYVLGVQMFLC